MARRFTLRHQPVCSRANMPGEYVPIMAGENVPAGRGCQALPSGHGDFLSLLAAEERVTHFARVRRLPANRAPALAAALVRALRDVPPALRRTLTYYNGPENTLHQRVNALLGTASYFCPPDHSWEKGTIENLNGLVRRHFPTCCTCLLNSAFPIRAPNPNRLSRPASHLTIIPHGDFPLHPLQHHPIPNE